MIYDYWFVQFDFPNENGKPYKSSGGKMVWNDLLKREIPLEWNVVTLRHFIKSEKGISYSSDNLSGKGIPMVNLNTFNSDSSFKYKGMKTYSGAYSKDKIIAPYDLLMCMTQQTSIDLETNSDIIGKSFIMPHLYGTDVISSMDVTNLKPISFLGRNYLNCLFAEPYFHKYISGFANGTKIKHLDIEGVLNFPIAIADCEQLKQFEILVSSFEKMKSKTISNNILLSSLRDWLLPMLMNGQVEISQ